MTISKDIKFDCAHMLSNYEGKCANLHGHTYHGTVTISGMPDGDTSMVVDYNDIKRVVDMFDHAIVFSAANQRNEAEQNLYEWANHYSMKYVEMPVGKSTAENMIAYISLLFFDYPHVVHVHVKLSETDGSWAETDGSWAETGATK